MREASIIFRETQLHLMSLLDDNPLDSRITIDYSDIISAEVQRKKLKGTWIPLKTLSGTYDIRGSKDELKVLKAYFDMIKLDPHHYAVPSEKDIEMLHKMLPNMSRIDREIEGFLEIIKSRIFSVDQRTSDRKLTQIEAQRILEEINQQMIMLGNLIKEEKISVQKYYEEFSRLKKREEEINMILNRGRRPQHEVASFTKPKVQLNITYNESHEDEMENEEEPHPYSSNFFSKRSATTVFSEYEDPDDFHL